MLKSKILKILEERNKKQNYLVGVINANSKQALHRKMIDGSFTAEDLFNIAEALDYEVVFFDKKKMEKVFVLEKSDFNNEEENK